MKICIYLLCALCLVGCNNEMKTTQHTDLNKPDTPKVENAENALGKIKSALLQAIQRNDVQQVMTIIEYGYDSNTRHFLSQLALKQAAWVGNKDILTSLLSLGVSPNSNAIDDEAPPLLVAKDFEIAQILIESGADINQTYGDLSPIERYFWHLPYMLSKGADIRLMGEANALFLSASDEAQFRQVSALLPFEKYQESYNDALFLLLRGGEDYPYNSAYYISKESEKEKKIVAIKEQETKIQRLKNAGASISPHLESFANAYNPAQANIQVLDFHITPHYAKEHEGCEFDTSLSKEDVLAFFTNADVTPHGADYALLFNVSSCHIQGTLKAYGEIWEFDISSDGRGHWYSPKGKRRNDRIFQTNFACDAPKCKPCIIDQHDEYANLSDEALRILAKTTSCRARDELNYRKENSHNTNP